MRHFDHAAPTVVHAVLAGLELVLYSNNGIRVATGEHVVSYVSRALTAAERNYSITDIECLAIVWAIKEFRPYLYGRHFKVIIDHHALCSLSSIKTSAGRLARWVLALQVYNFCVVYKSGKNHQDVDALSSCPLPLTAISRDQFQFNDIVPLAPLSLTSIPSEQRQDPWIMSIIGLLENPPSNSSAHL